MGIIINLNIHLSLFIYKIDNLIKCILINDLCKKEHLLWPLRYITILFSEWFYVHVKQVHN